MTALPDAPLELGECEACCGEGAIETPRPFWDDPYYCSVSECKACNGVGWVICEAEGD